MSRGVDPDGAWRWVPAAPAAEPGISVVVLAVGRSIEHHGLERCLRSLVDQTLAREQFDVVVVTDELTGPVVDAVEQAVRDTELRIIELAGRGTPPAAARDAGIAAAGRRYTTFVNGTDHVSATYLETLLARAAPDVVATADIASSPQRPPDDDGWSQWFIGGRAVATDVLRAVRSDPLTAAGGETLFWTGVSVRTGGESRRCPPRGATYYRTTTVDVDDASDFEAAVGPELEAVARLERLTAAGGQHADALVRGAIALHAGRIGEYLREHPSDHDRFVTAIDRAAILRFPYERANLSPAQHLVIAYNFPPYVDTGAVVTAKRLRGNARVVDVVANAMDSVRGVDETAARIAGPFIARQAFLNTPTYFDDWGAIEQFAIAGRALIRQWEAERNPYVSVYSRAHFAASHVLAALYKLSRPSVVWTAEFSDPLSRDIQGRNRGRPVVRGPLLAELRAGLERSGGPAPRSRNLFVWAEEVAYVLADELVFTNHNQLDYMLGYCSSPGLAALARAKAVVRPQPSLPPAFYTLVDSGYHLDDDAVHVAYFGNVYATRGLDDVLAAIADPDLRGQVVLHVFSNGGAEIGDRAAEFKAQDFVRVNPYRSYLEFLNLTTRFDCLIVNDASTDGTHGTNPYLPSKLSDYRGSGTPVWGLVEPGSALSRESLDLTSPLGNIPAARAVLRRLVVTADRESVHMRPSRPGPHEPVDP